MIFANQVTLCGKVVKDPIFAKTKSEKSVCKIILVVEKSIGSTSRSDYIPIAMWGKKAEIADNKIKRGDTLMVLGTVSQERWETKENEKRSRIVVQADKFWIMPNGSDRIDRLEECQEDNLENSSWDNDRVKSEGERRVVDSF